MIPHTCRVKHDPPHSYGDCLRASVASVLNIDPPEQVPHFFEDHCSSEEGMRRLDAFLADQGLRAYWTCYSSELSQQNILEMMKANNSGIYYLLFGRNADNCEHVVICKDNKIVHDTAWISSGLPKPNEEGIWVVLVFVPSFICG